MENCGDTNIIKDEQIAYIAVDKSTKIKRFVLKNGDSVVDVNDLKSVFGDLKVQNNEKVLENLRCKVCKRSECWDFKYQQIKKSKKEPDFDKHVDKRHSYEQIKKSTIKPKDKKS